MARLAFLLSARPVHAVRRLGLVAIAGVALLCTPPLLARVREADHILDSEPALIAWVLLCTVGLSLLLGRAAVRARTVAGAWVWLVAGGALFGALDAGLSLAGVTALRGSGNVLGALVLGGLFGGLFGAPLGVAYGVLYAPLATPAVRAQARPTHEAADRLALRVGAVLLAAAALGPLWPHAPTGTAVGLVAGLAALGCLGVALFRMHARRRFVHALAAGSARGYRLEPRTGAVDERELLPLFEVEVADGVLVAVGAAHPYRGARGVQKLALVPLDGARPQLRDLGPALGSTLGWLFFATLLLAALLAALGWVGGTGAPGAPGGAWGWD
ncbi:MAG: hypothetical protein IT373_08940 [Polyangiaceae bacterium]|nr:hypothetical protein [Polyangiaceae bacterium]